MSVAYRSNNPAQLLASFKQAIANHQNGRAGQRIDTWAHVVHNGKDYFTHTSHNWGQKAWFCAEVEGGQLSFYITQAQNVQLTRDIYAYYSGHMIETFIRHFASAFSLAQATPNAAGSDSQF